MLTCQPVTLKTRSAWAMGWEGEHWAVAPGITWIEMVYVAQGNQWSARLIDPWGRGPSIPVLAHPGCSGEWVVKRVLLPPPTRWRLWPFPLSVCVSVCQQDYWKSNEPISLKLGVVIGLSNQNSWLTSRGAPDQFSIFLTTAE